MCSNNKLSTLEGSPKEVGRNFICACSKLTTLLGSPKKVGGNFDCSSNNLTTLEGSPESVAGYFDCSYNKLTTLDGVTKSIGLSLYCYNNPLTSVEYKGDIKGELIHKFSLLENFKEPPITTLKNISDVISMKVDIERSGSCMLFAELFNRYVIENNPELMGYYKVVEGYVSPEEYSGIRLQHTWVELNNGDKIDPTFKQFSAHDNPFGGRYFYKKRVKNKYTPLEYEDLCLKYPEDLSIFYLPNRQS
jgi:hypothetical protein